MRRHLGSLLVSSIVALSGCASSATPTPAPLATSASGPPPTATPIAPTVSPAPPLDLGRTDYFSKVGAARHTGGTLVMAEWSTVATFNPYYAQAISDVEAQAPSFDPLLTIGYDLAYVPDMATNIPTVANGDVKLNGAGMDVTWRLKTGMKWSDGQPVNCADLEATWKWIMDPANTGLSGGTVGWEDITAIDGGTGTTCVMHFGKTFSAYLLLVIAVLPKHYIETIPVKDATTRLYPLANPKSAVYSGPYIPTDIKPNAQITYAPNADWATIGYGADTSRNHAPYLDSLVFTYFADASAMLAAYRNGSIDVALGLSDADIDGVKDIDASQKLIQTALFTDSVFFNNKSFKAKFGDDYKTIIRAIMTTTDVDAVIAGPMGGSVTRSCNNLAIAGEWFHKAESCPKTDPSAAAASLDAAGWTVNPATGYREKGGVKLSVDYCTTTRAYRIDAITLMSAQLKLIGIDSTVNNRPAQPDLFGGWNDVAADTKCNTIHGNYDVVMHGYVSSPDPTSGYLVYTTKGLPDPAPHDGQNETRISIPAIDAAYEIVNTSLDPAEIAKAMGTIQDIYGSDQNTFELPLFLHRNLWLFRPEVRNFVGNPSTSTGVWNVGDWWLDR